MIDFAFIDRAGRPTGGGKGRALPDGAVALTPPFTTEDLTRIRFRDGQWEERTDLKPPPPPTPEETAVLRTAALEAARARTVERVNDRVDALRRRIYTDIAGQDALYLEKRAEAVAYVRQTDIAGEPRDLGDFPLLANEVGITAPTPWQLAQVWLHRSDQFKAVGAATERARMIAANAIAAAPDEDTLDRIHAELVETLGRLPL